MTQSKNIIILFFLSISLWNLQAQSTQNVKGTVIDKDSDFPLPGAEISVVSNGKQFGAVTDFNGEYMIKKVPVGKISITAKFVGYGSQTFQNLDLEAGKELVVNFYLTEKVSKLDEVVINVKKKNEHTVFAVSSNYEMDAKQINRYAGSLNDVSRMAMNYAGVASNNDSQNSIVVRGNNPNSLLWMMEGIAIPNPNHYSAAGSSGGPVSMINTNTLGKSEFLAGAFPANFGNTTSAAFDLRFRTGNKDKYEFVGQIGFAGAELGAEGPISRKNKSSFMVNYRYSTLELFDKLGINLGTGTAVPKYHDGSFLINLPTKKAGNFRIWTIAGQSKIHFLTSKDGGDNLYLDYSSSDLRTYNLSTISGLNHKYFFNKKLSIYSSVSFSRLDQRVQFDTLNTNSNRYVNLYHDKIITNYTGLKTELKYKHDVKNLYAVGSEATFINMDMLMVTKTQTIDYKNTVNADAVLWGNYINWKHRFSDQLVANTGLRVQYFNLNRQILPEPRLGFEYKLNSRTKLSAAYGLHSNIHSLLAYFSKHNITPNTFEYANKQLKATRSHHFILGFQRDVTDKLHFKLETYYQYLFDVPVYHSDDETYSIINAGYSEPGGAQLFFPRLYSDGKGKNYGIDLTLEQGLNKGFYFLFTGSIYKSLYQAHDGKWRNTAWNGDFMSSFLAGKEFRFSKKSALNFDVNLNYSGGRRYTPIDKQASILAEEAVYDKSQTFALKLPDYFRTDLKISYKLSGKHITQEWQLDLRNIFNRKNTFSQRYNKIKNDTEFTYQTGFLPVMQYRILF